MNAAADLVALIERRSGRPGRKIGRNVRLLCPAHDDHRPSLDVAEAADGSPLVICRACGATLDKVCDALGLPVANFLPNRNGGVDVEWLPTGGKPLAVYDYEDAAGQLVQQVIRDDHKQFPQRRPDPSSKTGWRWNLQGVTQVPYRLPRLVEQCQLGGTVHVVEGEKDVHAVERAGGVATTNPGGAGKWRDAYSQHLRGAGAIVIIADNDPAGLAHAGDVARSLRSVLAAECPPVSIVSTTHGNDASDHLAAGGTLADLAPVDEAHLHPPAGVPELNLPDVAQPLVPPPGDPMAVARQFVKEHHITDNGTRLLRHHRGDFYRYDGRCWPEAEERKIRAKLYQWLEHAVYAKESKGGPQLEPFEPNKYKIANVVDALGGRPHRPRELDAPAWRDGRPALGRRVVARDGERHPRPLHPDAPPALAAVLHLHALDLAVQPATRRARGGSRSSASSGTATTRRTRRSQEVMGYVLCGDTSLQKMFMRRSARSGAARGRSCES